MTLHLKYICLESPRREGAAVESVRRTRERERQRERESQRERERKRERERERERERKRESFNVQWSTSKYTDELQRRKFAREQTDGSVQFSGVASGGDGVLRLRRYATGAAP